LASISPVIAAGNAGATAPATKSPVQSILSESSTYLTRIRTYFLCSTAKCKKDRTSLLKTAKTSMGLLSQQASVATRAKVQSRYRPALALFESDVDLLQNSYDVFFHTTSSATLSGEVGNVFYLTSDIESDVNVLHAAEKKSTVSFNLWVVGEAATLVAMQTDASALQSSSATTSIGIYANQLLEAESHALLAHAHGPNTSFNALIDTFAHNQLRISQSEILYLQGKKAPLSETQVANLNVSVSSEFAALIKAETKLVKKK
jgi:hypothetical protein